MSRALNDLDPSFKPRAIELLARLTEAVIPVLIVNTRRTAEEQAVNLANGTSWIVRSKHQDGLAIDVAPYSIHKLRETWKLEWNSSDPIWEQIGKIGESLGLTWGGRWKQKDMGHFEV